MRIEDIIEKLKPNNFIEGYDELVDTGYALDEYNVYVISHKELANRGKPVFVLVKGNVVKIADNDEFHKIMNKIN